MFGVLCLLLLYKMFVMQCALHDNLNKIKASKLEVNHTY